MIWCASICRYNTVMKLVFLGTSTSIIYYMRYHRIIKLTYDKEQDTFKHVLLIAPSAVLALLTTHNYTILEVCRSNSIGSHTNPVWSACVRMQHMSQLRTSDGFCKVYCSSCAYCRFFGRSPSTWKQLQYCHSWCCFSGRRTLTI